MTHALFGYVFACIDSPDVYRKEADSVVVNPVRRSLFLMRLCSCLLLVMGNHSLKCFMVSIR